VEDGCGFDEGPGLGSTRSFRLDIETGEAVWFRGVRRRLPDHALRSTASALVLKPGGGELRHLDGEAPRSAARELGAFFADDRLADQACAEVACGLGREAREDPVADDARADAVAAPADAIEEVFVPAEMAEIGMLVGERSIGPPQSWVIGTSASAGW
jgi:hypothetical protein